MLDICSAQHVGGGGLADACSGAGFGVCMKCLHGFPHLPMPNLVVAVISKLEASAAIAFQRYSEFARTLTRLRRTTSKALMIDSQPLEAE